MEVWRVGEIPEAARNQDGRTCGGARFGPAADR